MVFLIQPLGSILSAVLTDPLGRIKTMILVNIPFAIGWFLMYRASAVWEIFVGMGLQGLAIGLLEAPILTYLGEICEPATRSILLGYTLITFTFGMSIIFVMNTFMAWRMVAMICFGLPFITAIALCFIPETPQWLLSKNRVADAEKSLRWLRGWVSSEVIAQEFHDLKRHSESFKSCNECIKQDVKCPHPPPTMREKLAEMKRKRTIKPFAIVVILFALSHMTGVLTMRPYMVQVFKAYESPIAPDRAAMIMSLLDNVAQLAFMCLVHYTGKRKLYLSMVFGLVVCTLVITSYGFIFLPQGFNSFDYAHHSNFRVECKGVSYIPLIFLYLWSFFSFCGFNGMPWILLSEMFPFKSRGIASGMAAAFYYLLGFIAKKTYYDLEVSMSLPGITLFYCIISLFGLISTYYILPETENRTLEEIELHFMDNSKKIIDWKIESNTAELNKRKNNKNKSGFDNRGFETECSKV
ncbi:facilitated trehalose transporter Tret1-like [Sitodiplosis mosellana]|uniref:facilitated trehalose transporter Tret1-like n=1 Tax=Sitodiplosis mosellana TaxID=263140 RepID=UPI002444FFA7|nr:facilitated trehalose transporter Tret1-like [Sitodiplosis mosellana]